MYKQGGLNEPPYRYQLNYQEYHPIREGGHGQKLQKIPDHQVWWMTE